MSNAESNKKHPDYAGRDLPDDEPYEDWGWRDRRAYLFREWMDAGTHRLMNKSQLANQFGVSRSTLYKDLDRIAEFVEKNLGDKHGAETVGVFKKAVAELVDEGEYKQAAQVQDMMGDWLERRGAVDKEPERQVVATADAADVDEEDMDFLDEVF